MEYKVNYTRITNSGRLTDKFLTAQVRKPLEDSRIDKGTVFAVAEITKPWFPNSQIGQKIINALVREYIKSSNTSNLVNFELAIKKVNKTLAYITQSGETDWIGNLNAILAVIHNNSLHLSQTGKAEAYLFRDGKIIHITEGSKQEIEPHPLKTFSDIASGNLKLHDKLLFSSPEVLDYFSLERLRQIICNSSPSQAATQISAILRQEKTKSINAIIVELLDKNELANKTLSETQEVIYLDQKNLANFGVETRKQLESIAPIFDKMGAALAKGYEKTRSYSKNTILPKMKSAWFKTINFSNKSFQNLKSKTTPVVNKISQPVKEKIAEKVKPIFSQKEAVESAESKDVAKNNYNVRYYQSQSQRFAPYKEKIAGFFSKLSKDLLAALEWLISPKNRALLYILLIIILVIILILSVGKLRQQQVSRQDEESARTTLTQMQDQYNNEVKLAILYNDTAKAKNMLSEMINNLPNIEKIPALASEATDLVNKVQDQLDKLTNTTRYKDLKPLVKFDNATNIVASGGNIFSIASGNNNFYTASTEQNSNPQELSLPTADGAAKALTNFDENGNALIYTFNQFIYKSGVNKDTLTKLKSSEDKFGSADRINIFAGNIYLLDSKLGQIYKYTKSGDTYSKASDYLDTAKVDIKEAVSLAIDGSIYVLTKNGQVVKLSKGQPQEFNLKDIPTPNDKITKPKAIFTNVDASSIYILDDNRVLEFDKTGKFIKQYIVSGLTNVSDFYPDLKNKKIYFLDSNNVYQGDL